MPERNFSDFPDRFHSPKSPEKKPKQIQMAGVSLSKDKDPKNNQDDFFINPDNLSFGVFDGVGGTPNGQLAAQKCSELIKQKLSEMSNYLSDLNSDGIKEILQNISIEVNSAISDGYTTGIFGVITTSHDGKRRAFITNIGDSRAYLIHQNVLYKETRDQNYVSYPNQDRLDKLDGKKLKNFKKYYVHDDQTVFQLYGQRGITPVVTEIELESRDVLLLVTDGIYKNLTKREISSTYKKNRYKDIETISHKLINRAYERSQEDHSRSTPDDMTVVIVKTP